MLSIICPTYNSEKEIKNLLKSLECQTTNDYEIIFVDKLSSDRTKKLIISSKIKNFSFYSNKDRGIYDAINFGIKKSRFNWIWILGSDDVIYKNTTIEELTKEVLIEEKSKVKAIYGTVIFLTSNLPFNKKFYYDDHFNKSLCQQSIVYKKEALLDENLFNIKYITTADYVMNLKLLKEELNNFKYIEKILAIYNDRGSSFYKKDSNFYKDSLQIRMNNIGSKVRKLNLIKSFFGRHGIVLFSFNHSILKTIKITFYFLFLILKWKKFK